MTSTTYDPSRLSIEDVGFDTEDAGFFSVCLSDGTIHPCKLTKGRSRQRAVSYVDLIRVLKAESKKGNRKVHEDQVIRSLGLPLTADTRTHLRRTVKDAGTDGKVFEVITPWLTPKLRKDLKVWMGQKLIIRRQAIRGYEFEIVLASGNPIQVRESIRRGNWEPDFPPELSTSEMALNLGLKPNKAITETAQKLHTTLFGIDGALVLWSSPDLNGLDPDQVGIATNWDRASVRPFGAPTHQLPGLPHPLTTGISKVLRDTELADFDRSDSRPKVWISSYADKFSDTLRFGLELGGTEFLRTKAIQIMHERSGFCDSFRGGKGKTLRELFDENTLNLKEFLPGTLCMHIIVFAFGDPDCPAVLVGQRGNVEGEKGAFSPTLEEQLDPTQDERAHDTVIRGMREELGIGPGMPIGVEKQNIRFLGLFREWGRHWCTGMVYAVTVDCTGESAVRSWFRASEEQKDQQECSGVLAIPLGEIEEQVRFLTSVRSGRMHLDGFEDAPRAGIFESGKEWHVTSAAVRAYLGMRHAFQRKTDWRQWMELMGQEKL